MEEVMVNFGGHNSLPNDFVPSSTLRPFWQGHVEQAARILGLNRERNPALIGIDRYYTASCQICGEPVTLRETDEGFIVTQVCPVPNGYENIDITVNCPSGLLVIGNDFRSLFRGTVESYSVEAVRGTIATIRAYEKVGMLHVLVGNSSPTFFQKGDNSLCFTTVYDPDTDERAVPGEGYKEVGYVCTDLWWVCAMDYELYKQLCRKKGIRVKDLRPKEILQVRPGKWVFTFDPMQGCDFETCFGRWASESDPVS